jgi:segregation and condensation protein B
MEDKEARSIIESILFMSGELVTLDTLRNIIEVDKYNTERLVKELISDYSLKAEGLMIVEVGGGYQMVTNPACAPWVKKLLSTAVPKKLTQSSLETMAIIAYKQPIIKAEIEAIRGVNSDGVVKTLLERRLIKILGRKEVPGRPLMYGTTNEFLQYFGLKELSELPTLKEFAEVDIPEPPENAGGEQEQLDGAGEEIAESAGQDLETLQEEVLEEKIQSDAEIEELSEDIDTEEIPEEEGRPQEV